MQGAGKGELYIAGAGGVLCRAGLTRGAPETEKKGTLLPWLRRRRGFYLPLHFMLLEGEEEKYLGLSRVLQPRDLVTKDGDLRRCLENIQATQLVCVVVVK